jgi:peptidyl-prolyl cis-trans isomerase A (cyclophilin A)
MFAIDGDVVSIAYNCFVFDDIANIYDSHLTDTISFKIGYSKQMRGLNYGIKLLQIGDKSKIIIPSYLGFGMSGYGKSVPPYSTLLLNIKLLNIEK